MKKYSTFNGHSFRVQSGVAKFAGENAFSSRGINFRAVVVATYTFDEDLDIEDKKGWYTQVSPSGTYCDLLAFSHWEGTPMFPLFRVPVLQPTSGVFGGHVWHPRATTIDLTGDEIDLSYANPSQYDGDHVLVTFVDDDFQQPIIIGCLPHPLAGTGDLVKDSLGIGHRNRLRKIDGNADLWRHHGTFYGIDKDGNFLLDTTRANSGDVSLTSEGSSSSVNGNVRLRVRSDSELTIEGSDDQGNVEKFELILKDNTLEIRLSNGESLILENGDNSTTLKIGTGAVSAAISEHLMSWWDSQIKPNIEGIFNAHVHTANAPSTPTTPPVTIMTLSAYPQNATSSKIKIPDG